MRPFESSWLSEADDKNALSLLRHAEIKRVQNFVLSVVSEAFQRLHDSVECSTVIMRPKLLHVFQHKRGWLFGLKNSGNVKEESAASIFKPLPVTDDAKRLAGKSTKQQFVIGNIFGCNFGYVPRRAFTKISFVGSLCV